MIEAVDGKLRSVVFYCPDTHLMYDGRTPYEKGVGGGVTARVRMARALAVFGHRVTMVVSCPRHETIDGVEYMPHAGVEVLEADVIVFNTSGGGMDLSPAHGIRTDAGLRVLWISGVDRPKGVGGLELDVIYAKSRFLRDGVRERWGLPNIPVFVAYNGFDEELFQAAEIERFERDPFRLVYLSHPSKGLAPAIEVLRGLRATDDRFTMHVFGGAELWGGDVEPALREPGTVWHGMVGQRALTRELLRSSFALHLQDREEPFGMALIESMRAGCVVMASPVGAYRELVRDGEDGILIDGPCMSERAITAAIGYVKEFTIDTNRRGRISGRAQSIPWSTQTMAQVWTADWDRRMGVGRADAAASVEMCPDCASESRLLLDGWHCGSCGFYQLVSQSISGPEASLAVPDRVGVA